MAEEEKIRNLEELLQKREAENTELMNLVKNLTSNIEELNKQIKIQSNQLFLLLEEKNKNGSKHANKRLHELPFGGKDNKILKRNSTGVSTTQSTAKISKHNGTLDGFVLNFSRKNAEMANENHLLNPKSTKSDISVNSSVPNIQSDESKAKQSSMDIQNEIIIEKNGETTDANDTINDSNKNRDENPNVWQRISYKNKKNQDGLKIQPIHVRNCNIDILYDMLSKDVGTNNFNIGNTGSIDKCKIFAANMESFNTIGLLLQKNDIEFFTYLHKNEKKKCFLLNGLPECNLDTVKRELIRYGLPENIEISRFVTGFMKNNPEIKSKFIVKIIIDPTFNEVLLKSIKSICGFLVTFKKLNSNGIIQCKNCQNYFHTASRCFLNYRCVKCLDQHAPGKCNKSDEEPPKCINCHNAKFDDILHTANNFIKCKHFRDKIQPLINKKNQNSGNKINSTINSNVNTTTKNVQSAGTLKNGSVMNTDTANGFSGGKKTYADMVAGNQKRNAVKNTGKITNSDEKFDVLIGLLSQLIDRFNKSGNNGI